ncbi:MAG: heavy metal transporter [Ancylobacter novellus]|uniref:Heavy metal transporter n=1 Tax=Ancylobacter novellus TaxID=921 RepID=A0A2W5KGM3_ANCNO|nr:MAG: heavy metal transporter [Ancylobacter novellus]
MIVLDVSGMKGEACAKKVQEAVSARDPAATVVVSQNAGRLSADTTLSPDEAVEAVRSAGYGAVFAFKA